MKKILCLTLSVVCALSLVACGNNKKPQNNETGENNTNVAFGEERDPNEIYTFDEENILYDAETLPDDYKNSDFDEDGLKNHEEISKGCNMYKTDTDGDGITDYDEVKNTKTDPAKWSTRGDNKSDLEYYLVNKDNFKEGYDKLDASGYRVYLAKAEDRLWMISKTSTTVFDDLETIGEAFQIKCFSGKVALDCSKYNDEVAKNIAIYKVSDNKAVKLQSKVTENRMVEFQVTENDIFVAVYSGE